MAQAKKKQATKTAKKATTRAQSHRKASTRTAKKQQCISNQERFHVYLVTAMSMIVAILLCANVAMMMV